MTFWHRLMQIVCWGWKKPVFWTVESWRGSSSLWISSDLLCTTCVLWLSKRYGVFFILPLSTKPRNIIAAQCPKREKTKNSSRPKTLNVFYFWQSLDSTALPRPRLPLGCLPNFWHLERMEYSAILVYSRPVRGFFSFFQGCKHKL